MSTYNVLECGALGDGRADDTYAIQAAFNRAYDTGGGAVLFPAGHVYVSGPVRIRSNTKLIVKQGATIRALPDFDHYTTPAFPGNDQEGTLWLYAENEENIEIVGGGTLDGNGPSFMGGELPTSFAFREDNGVDRRPHLITFVGCRNVRIHDVSFKDSAYWCIHLAGCDGVDLRGVRINNNTKIRNGDGIDIDHSRNVHVSGCTIVSGDDSICLKCRREFDGLGPTENISVVDCHLVSTSCAVKLGSENTEAIRNVVVSNCTISASNRGIAIQNRDEGCVENVIFANIIIETRLFGDEWWGKAEPIYLTAIERGSDEQRRFPPGEPRRPVGAVRNVRFTNIVCRGENGVYISGSTESRPTAIVLDRVSLTLRKCTAYEGGIYDRRPTENEPVERCATAGIYVRNADEVTLRSCTVRWSGEIPDFFGPAVRGCDVRGLKIADFDGESAHPDREEALLLEDCTGREAADPRNIRNEEGKYRQDL